MLLTAMVSLAKDNDGSYVSRADFLSEVSSVVARLHGLNAADVADVSGFWEALKALPGSWHHQGTGQVLLPPFPAMSVQYRHWRFHLGQVNLKDAEAVYELLSAHEVGELPKGLKRLHSRLHHALQEAALASALGREVEHGTH